MMATESIRDRLWQELKDLPEAQLREVLEFVEFLHAESTTSDQQPKSDAGGDPLLEFIRGSSHGQLAQGIDDELYDA